MPVPTASATSRTRASTCGAPRASAASPLPWSAAPTTTEATMTTDLAVRAPAGLPDKIGYATQLAKSDLLPKQYRDKPANILLVMEFGEYLGLPPVAALRLIHIIDNKPVASAELISGRVRAAGHRLRVRYDQQRKAA